jgi:predicted RNA polymerase sigma factor
MAATGVTKAAEEVARASYGRLLALLAAPTGDIPAAEDALADAFERALMTWPTGGIPDNPDGWFLTVARNRLRDLWKSSAVRTSVTLEDVHTVLDDVDLEAIPDKRLELLFVCAHPAIEASIRTPLMLQTVLGVESSQIAAVFALPEAAMAQRLVRAKRRIREARIPFAVPLLQDMQSRLPVVLEAIYGAYAIDWQGVAGTTIRDSLAGEALYLAETLAQLLPSEAETLGLAALISLSMSRAPARSSPSGEPVPLDEQDKRLWDASLIARGEAYLTQAHTLNRIGRFQLEAAIQSVHCDRAQSGVTNWIALKKLHEALVEIAPTLGARVSLAATIGEVDSASAGLAALDAIEGADRFQPAWATRAHLLAEAGRHADARLAFEKAMSLTTDAGIRSQLLRRSKRL